MIKLTYKGLPEFKSYCAYQTMWSAGCDLTAQTGVSIQPHDRALVGTGLYIHSFETSPYISATGKAQIFLVPELQIRSRSGLSLKQGLVVCNSPATIDADFKLEIKVILLNTSNQTVWVSPGDRIAQLVGNLVFRTNLPLKTDERTGGFGSTDTRSNV